MPEKITNSRDFKLFKINNNNNNLNDSINN